MVVVNCLRQKGSGPSEWSESVFSLPKQNVMDAMSDMHGEVGVGWGSESRETGVCGSPHSGCYNRKRKLGGRSDIQASSSFEPIRTEHAE